MPQNVLNELESATPAVVRAAAREFATALTETPQFKNFQQTYQVFSNDAIAHQTLSVYQAKAKSLRAMLMLNAVSDAERAELEQLKNDYLSHPSVQAYAKAEAELTAICQQAAAMISAATGLNYAASCGASCCG